MSQPDTPLALQDEPSATQTAAAQAFNSTIQQNAPQPTSNFAPTPVLDTMKDTVMGDDTSSQSPAQIDPSAPSRSTPVRTTNGTNEGSRATSQHPEASGSAGLVIPKEAAKHGAPTRQYLNGHVTGVLLEGMKIITKEQPKDPLRVLGEYLLQRSQEVENKVRRE